MDLKLLKEQGHLEFGGILQDDFREAFAVVEPLILQEHPVYRVVCEISGPLLVVSCHVSAKVVAPCDRCLEDTCVEVESDVEQVYSWGEDVADEEITFLPAGVSKLDVKPLILEGIICGTPMRIICTSECKGLCPSCGVNLNQGMCSCHPVTDERWKKLLEYQKGRESN